MRFVITGLLFDILQITTSLLKIPVVEKLIRKERQPFWVIRQFFTDGTPPDTGYTARGRTHLGGVFMVAGQPVNQSPVTGHSSSASPGASHQSTLIQEVDTITGHFFTSHRSPVIQAVDKITGHFLPVTGHRSSSHWSPVTGHQSKSPGKYHRALCLDKITSHLSLVIGHRASSQLFIGQ